MKKRYIIYLCVIAMVVFGSVLVKPVLPTIQLPGETLIDNVPFVGSLTNTFVATVLTWIVMLVLVLALKAKSRSADEVPSGFYNLFEMMIEGAYGFVENSAGKWARKFFPFFMTFVLYILIANWIELIPGVDSIGIKEDLAHHEVQVAEVAAEAEGNHLSEAEIHAIEEEASRDGGKFNGIFLLSAEGDEAAGKQIVPFVRAAATDLNFTIALALVSVFMTQYFGFKALGMGYLKKFFTFPANKIAKSPLGLMDFLVGILEFISEISKILSFAFRLFGNVFAGQVLLFVIGVLLPVANMAVYGLEFFVGAIQAAVFAMLTLTFMSMAVQGHHEEAH